MSSFKLPNSVNKKKYRLEIGTPEYGFFTASRLLAWLEWNGVEAATISLKANAEAFLFIRNTEANARITPLDYVQILSILGFRAENDSVERDENGRVKLTHWFKNPDNSGLALPLGNRLTTFLGTWKIDCGDLSIKLTTNPALAINSGVETIN